MSTFFLLATILLTVSVVVLIAITYWLSEIVRIIRKYARKHYAEMYQLNDTMEKIDRHIKTQPGRLARFYYHTVKNQSELKSETTPDSMIPTAETSQHIANFGPPVSPVSEAFLLSTSPSYYWEDIVARVTSGAKETKHVVLLNHQAAHLLAWAEIARNNAIHALRPNLPENNNPSSEAF